MENELMKAFGFDAEELELNSQGQISVRQRAMLDIYLRNFGCGTAAAVAAFAVTAAAFISIPFVIGETFSHDARLALWSVALLIVCVAAVFIGLGFYRIGDLKKGRVTMTTGNVVCSTKKFRHGRYTAYYVKFGDVKIQLDTAAKYQAFENGKKYRCFYVKYPPVHIIMSAEPIYGCITAIPGSP